MRAASWPSRHPLSVSIPVLSWLVMTSRIEIGGRSYPATGVALLLAEWSRRAAQSSLAAVKVVADDALPGQ